jgi:putative endonuclease
VYYVYALRSLKDKKFYIGFTKNINKRLAAHNNRQVQATRNRISFEVVYYEASRNINDVINREKYLKTTYGKKYLTNRLRNDLHG